MAAPRDSDLPILNLQRHTITYAGTVAALAGTAIGFDRLPFVLGAGAVAAVFGVLEMDAAPGQDVTIAVAGICQMISGGAVTIGSRVMADPTARAIIAPGVNNPVFGRALTATTAAGQKMQVLITREGLY
jgi:hypothetical protein